MSVGDLLLVFGSFLPGIFYLGLMARYDRAVRAPRRYLFGVYALGMFSVVPAAFLELAGSELVFGPLEGNPTRMVLAAFFLIGPVEEVCKFLAVRSIYESEYFTDPLDGVVYAAAAAMGFASLENAFYVAELGWEVFWLRAALAIPGHLVFAVFWGYELGRRKFGLGGRVGWGLGLAAFFHGLYDALLMSNVTWLAVLVVPLMVGMIWGFRRRVRSLWELARAYESGVAPRAEEAPRRSLHCPSCRRYFGADQAVCPDCGAATLRLVCTRCREPTSWRRDACGTCAMPYADRAQRCWRCDAPFPPHLTACPLCGAE